MKKVIICGSAGMVGRTVIAEALENHNDCEIWAADLNVDVFSKIENPRFHAILNNDLERVLQENYFDAMLQMAFPRNVQPDQWAPGIGFCFDTLFLASKYKVRRVVHVSSQSLYGWQRESAAGEETPVMLVSPYTTGKYCAELLTHHLFEPGKYTNVRLSTIIGPLTKERVVNKFIEKVIKGENIIVQGGNQIFSFLDVRDAAKGLLAVVLGNNELRPVYNIGTKEFASLVEIANITVEEGKKHGYCDTKVIVEPADIIMNNMIMVTAAREDFGWEANYSLIDSVKTIFDYRIKCE